MDCVAVSDNEILARRCVVYAHLAWALNGDCTVHRAALIVDLQKIGGNASHIVQVFLDPRDICVVVRRQQSRVYDNIVLLQCFLGESRNGQSDKAYEAEEKDTAHGFRMDGNCGEGKEKTKVFFLNNLWSTLLSQRLF